MAAQLRQAVMAERFGAAFSAKVEGHARDNTSERGAGSMGSLSFAAGRR